MYFQVYWKKFPNSIRQNVHMDFPNIEHISQFYNSICKTVNCATAIITLTFFNVIIYLLRRN